MHGLPSSWFVRFLFRLTLSVSFFLILLVIVAPWVENRLPTGPAWARVGAMLARDKVVRRTSIGSAIGLGATAFVFFRSPAAPKRLSPRDDHKPPPPNIAGA